MKKRLKRLLRWLRDGNKCNRCPACWEDSFYTDCGTEYDCGCYIKGEEWEDRGCRIPFALRWLLARRATYLQGHQYDGCGDWYEESERVSSQIRGALEHELCHGVIGHFGDDGKFYEWDRDATMRDMASAAQYAYSDATFKPRKRLPARWVELIRETVMVPVDYVKSFIFE